MDQIITRHRHEPKRRTLTVAEAAYLTPHMVRIALTGESLDGFTSLSPDDHIKLFFDTGADKPVMRDYTPRHYDAATNRLVIDFAVHEAGPATDWAINAKPGDLLTIGGPKGSAVIAPVFDWWLLIGDETALPAIGRRVEEFAIGTAVTTLVAIPDQADQQRFEGSAKVTSHWVARPVAAAAEAAPLLDAARALDLPQGRGFIWIAAEAMVARTLRDHFRDERGHNPQWIKAAGYWTQGQADASDKALD